MSRNWPTIRNCNYADGSAIAAALQLAEDCDDIDLIGSLDDLEAVLAEHAESDSELSRQLCREAEDCVEHAVLVITGAFEEDD